MNLSKQLPLAGIPATERKLLVLTGDEIEFAVTDATWPMPAGGKWQAVEQSVLDRVWLRIKEAVKL